MLKCVWGGGGVGYCIFSWKRHIYDYNDRFDLWVDMGKFYLYLLGCCLEVPPSQNVSFYSYVLWRFICLLLFLGSVEI